MDDVDLLQVTIVNLRQALDLTRSALERTKARLVECETRTKKLEEALLKAHGALDEALEHP
jgi:predicted translin family RNA/ssDNA-binding protein